MVMGGSGPRLPSRRPQTAVAPGSSAGVFRGRLVIVSGSASGTSGVFVYSPAPGPGNLIVSITATAGLDSFGNNYGAGVNIGNQSGAHAGIDASGRIFLFDGSDKAIFELSAIIGGILALDTTGATQAIFSGGSAPFGLIGPATALVSGNPEVWRNVTPPSGWSGTLRYKMLSEVSRVAIDYALSHTALTAQTTVALITLPASPVNYQPAHSATLECVVTNNTANGTPAPSTFVGSGGAVSAFNVPVGTTRIDCHESYPLD